MKPVPVPVPALLLLLAACSGSDAPAPPPHKHVGIPDKVIGGSAAVSADAVVAVVADATVTVGSGSAGPREFPGRDSSPFTVMGDTLWTCDGGRLRATPIGGGPEIDHGECNESPPGFVGDATARFRCGYDKLTTWGSDDVAHDLADVVCVPLAVDADYFYFDKPGWNDNKDTGVFRIPRAGGAAVKIVPTASYENTSIVLDGEGMYILRYYAGTIVHATKSGGAQTPVASDVKWLDGLTVTPDMLYWYAQSVHEIHARKRSGGGVKTIARDVSSMPVFHAGAFYWAAGDEMGPKRIVRLALGETKPTELTGDVKAPDLAAAPSGVVYSDDITNSIYVLP